MLVTEDALGAWVLRCNPRVWDLEAFIADGGRVIDDWSVADNYRSGLMEHGQRVLLWVSGPKGARLPRGVWGSGWVTRQVRGEISWTGHGEEDESEGRGATRDERGTAERRNYWLDDSYRSDLYVPCHVELFPEPVRAEELAAVPGLESLEVVRSPQMANPSWISKEELALLEPLLPAWPRTAEPADDLISVGPGGAGHGDPLTNRVVEEVAVAVVRDAYELDGWTVTDVSARKLGWDLECRDARGDVELVEVKGVSRRQPTILLTANERRAAELEPQWRLAVVTRALTSPELRLYEGQQVVGEAEPYVYRARLSEPGTGGLGLLASA